MTIRRQMSEKQVLKSLDIPDFRHLSKDKVMSFVSMIPNMDSEVAMKAIEQFPAFAKMLTEVTKDYQSLLEESLKSGDKSVEAYYDTCNVVLDSLKQMLDKDDLSFEEKQVILDRMFEVQKMVGEKDTEHKNHILKITAIAGGVALVVTGAAVAALGGKADFQMPTLKS